jgi:hypothetical protein
MDDRREGGMGTLIRVKGIPREVEAVVWGKDGVAHVTLQPISRWEIIRRRLWRVFVAMRDDG